jgi:hypothetical protein
MLKRKRTEEHRGRIRRRDMKRKWEGGRDETGTRGKGNGKKTEELRGRIGGEKEVEMESEEAKGELRSKWRNVKDLEKET